MPQGSESNPLLVKNLGAFEIFAISAGTMIGAGIFVLPGILASKVGPSSILCFVISGAIALCAALSVSELATAMPKSGGSYYFVSRAMGGMLGSIVGLGTFIALIFKGAFAFIGAGDYAHELVKVAPVISALALCALMVALNISGTGAAGRFQNLIVVVMLSIFVAFVVHGMFSVQARRFESFFRGSTFTFFEATGMVFITFLGVLKATAVSEEVRNPSRDIPLGIISALVVVTFAYTLIMVVTVGVLPLGTLAGAVAPIADAARIFSGPGGLVIIVIAGLLATLSTGNTALMSSSRYPLAMARDGLMPNWLTGVDSVARTPVRSILPVGLITVLLIIFVDIENIVKLGSVFNLVVFVLVNASVLLLRTSNPKWYSPTFKAPLFPLVQILGIAGCLVLVPFMGTASIVAAGLLIIIGSAWFYFYGRGRVSPAYGLRDAVRTSIDELESRQAVNRHNAAFTYSWRLMIPVLSEKQPDNLLKIADIMSEEFDERVYLVYFHEVPSMFFIRQEDVCMSPGSEPEERLRLSGECKLSTFRNVDIYTTSRNAGFAAVAKSENTDLALISLSDPNDRSEMREIRRMVGALPCDCAVYGERELKGIRRILVVARQPEERLKLTIAGAVAKQVGATVTVIRVVPSSSQEITQGDLELRILKSGILHGIPLNAKIVRSNDVVGAILTESQGYDLLIAGSKRSGPFSHFVFGRTAEEMLRKAQCPSIVAFSGNKTQQSIPIRALKRLVGSP